MYISSTSVQQTLRLSEPMETKVGAKPAAESYDYPSGGLLSNGRLQLETDRELAGEVKADLLHRLASLGREPAQDFPLSKAIIYEGLLANGVPAEAELSLDLGVPNPHDPAQAWDQWLEHYRQTGMLVPSNSLSFRAVINGPGLGSGRDNYEAGGPDEKEAGRIAAARKEILGSIMEYTAFAAMELSRMLEAGATQREMKEAYEFFFQSPAHTLTDLPGQPGRVVLPTMASRWASGDFSQALGAVTKKEVWGEFQPETGILGALITKRQGLAYNLAFKGQGRTWMTDFREFWRETAEKRGYSFTVESGEFAKGVRDEARALKLSALRKFGASTTMSASAYAGLVSELDRMVEEHVQAGLETRNEGRHT